MPDEASYTQQPYRFFGIQEEGILGTREGTWNNAPIGVFDSGFGGLTVAREIMKALPNESLMYVGDTEHCPYGIPLRLQGLKQHRDSLISPLLVLLSREHERLRVRHLIGAWVLLRLREP